MTIEIAAAEKRVLYAADEFEREHNVREISMKDLALAAIRRKQLYDAVQNLRDLRRKAGINGPF